MAIHNLPRQATTFVGREQEIADLTALLNDPTCRLLTVVGPGGIGKTRLAIEAAARMQEIADGIYFVPLQPINVVDNIPSALATALNFQFLGKSEPVPQLLHFLHDKHLLLVLDNFEHLLDGAELVMDILHAAPRVKLLITSREALNLQEEWVRSITGLNYPHHEPTEALERYSAVQLFERRVQQVRGDFSLAAEEQDVLRVCRMVEGMPLALELAAGRAKALSCAIVADEIQHSMDFLTASLRNLPERHRSMQAVFEWSWRLLTEGEQLAFMKLSVFRGGFRAEAAQAVAGASMATLSALVEKSLLRMEVSGRYQFHDLLRRFALSKLNEVPEIRERILDTHCTYFAHFLAQHEAGMSGPQTSLTVEEIGGEIANIRAAWTWAVDHMKIEALEQSRGALFVFYGLVTWSQERESVFQAAVAALRSGHMGKRRLILLGHLLINLGQFRVWLAKFESSLRFLHEGLDIMRRSGDRQSTAQALLRLGDTVYFQGEFQQAYLYTQESLTLASQLSGDLLTADCKLRLASILKVLGNYQKSRQLLEDVSLTYKQQGSGYILIQVLRDLGDLQCICGEYAQARLILQESLAMAENLDREFGIAQGLEVLGQLDHAVGDFDAAQHDFEEGLKRAQERRDPRTIGWCLLHGGHLACTVGDYEAARKSFQEVLALGTAEGEKWKQVRAIAGLGSVAYLQGNLPEAMKYLNDGLARSREMGFRLGEAQILNVLGRVATAGANFREAGQIFAEALKIGLDIETPPTILETFVGVAALKNQEGDDGYASELSKWCLQHPALHANTRAQARILLGKITSAFSPEEGVPGWQSSDLATVASDALMRLSIEQGQASPATHDALTERELEVLRLLVTRRTNREIADTLFISVGTVKTHVHRICSKLHITSRQQVATRAAELHLI